MPVVPRPQNISVVPQFGRAAAFDNPLAMAAATLAGRQTSEMGETIQSSAQGLAEAADVLARSAREKAEATVALDATNRLQGLKFDLSNPNTGYKSLLGGNAVKGIDGWPLADHYLSVFDQGWKDISSKLTPGPQAMFDQSAANMRKDFAWDLITHEAEQGRVWQSQVLDTAVINATGAIVSGTGDNDAGHVAKARAALTADGLGQGLSGEALDKQTNFAFGRRVVEPVVTARLSQGDVAGAKAFFDTHRDGMDGDDADVLDKRLAEAAQALDIKTAVDDLWNRLGPKSLNDPIDWHAIENDLVDRHGGDDQALMLARDEVFHRLFGFTQARDDTHAGYVNFAINRIKDGASPSQVASLPQVMALPKDKQRQIVDWHREELADRLMGLTPDQKLDRQLGQFAAYHDLSGDDALTNLSAARVQATVPTVGDDLNAQLLAQKQAADAGQPTRLDDTTLRGISAGLGIDPDPSPFDVEGKARLGVLRSKIEAAIAAAEAGGKILTPDERRQIAMSEGAALVRDHPFFDLSKDVQDVLEMKPENAFGADGAMSLPGDIERAVKAAKDRGEQVWKVQMAPTLVVSGAGENTGRGVMVPAAGQAPDAWLITPKGQRTTWDTETDGDKIRLTLVDLDTKKRSDPVVIDTPAYGKAGVLDFGLMGRLIMVSPSDPGVARKFFEGIGNGAARAFSEQAAHDVNLYDEVTQHPWETAGNVLGAVPGVVRNGLYRLTPQGQGQTAIDGFNNARDFFGNAKDAYDHQRLGTFAGETLGQGIPEAIDTAATGGLGDATALAKGAEAIVERRILTPFRPVGIGSAHNVYDEMRPLGSEFPELKGVNPHYVKDAPAGTNTNCASCANAVDARLRGQNPTQIATPNRGYASHNDLLPSAPYGIKPPNEINTIEQVKDYVAKAGEGATGIVVLEQGGAVEHVINVVNRNGKVTFIDGQSEHIVRVKPDVPVRFGSRY